MTFSILPDIEDYRAESRELSDSMITRAVESIREVPASPYFDLAAELARAQAQVLTQPRSQLDDIDARLAKARHEHRKAMALVNALEFERAMVLQEQGELV